MKKVQNQEEIKNYLKELLSSFGEKNLEKCLDCYGDEIFMFGSGIDEIAKSKNAMKKGLKRDLTQMHKLKVTLKYSNIGRNGNVAWVAGIMTYTIIADNKKYVNPYRFTSVLEKQNKRWKIVQAHLSEPAAGQKAGESFSK